MTDVIRYLQSQPFILIFTVVAVGMWLGAKKIGGISLGSVVCIILTGLIISILAHAAGGVSLELPDVLKTVFFNLFIFAIGVKIGPQFFSGLERDGWHLITIGIVVALLAPVIAFACGAIFDWPPGTVAGVLAGSNNSSATFGAASAAVQSGGRTLGPGETVALVTGSLSAAFALCYTVSQVQFVLLMKLMPKLAGFDAAAEAAAFEKAMRAGRASPLPGTAEAGDVEDTSITVRTYRVGEQLISGRTLAEIAAKAPRVSIEAVRRGDRWLKLEPTLEFETGDEVVVSAPLEAQVRVRAALGPEVPDVEARTRIQLRTVDVVVGKKEIVGRTPSELREQRGSGLYANALFRAGAELPITDSTRLRMGDVIRVTGSEARIASLANEVGQVVRASHVSDVMTLAIGLVIGAVLGTIPVPLFGAHISFGAAMVLITGILFGWLKTRHPALGGPISEGARNLLEVLGLNTFTAVLAINSGPAVFEVMDGGPVWSLIASCLVISAVPALAAWWIGRHVLHMNPALLMGAIAGARQNTSSMQAAQEISHSAVPGIGYPVPLAITTVVLSMVAYLFALFV